MNYIGAALTIVTGMAWNDAVKSFIEKHFPQNGSTVVSKFIYAGALTVISILLVYLLWQVSDTAKEYVPDRIQKVINASGSIATGPIIGPYQR